jgi:hypothetical protein
MFKAGVVAGVVLFASVGSARAQDSTKEEETPPRYAGSEISLRAGFGAIGLDASSEQTYNPTFVQGISIDPRWRLNKKITLSGHFGVDTELTDSDGDTYERQPLLNDTQITAAYALPKLPGKLGGSVGLRLTLPTSKESLARHILFNIAPSISLSRPFELTDKITIAPFVSFRVGVNVATNQEATYDAPTIASCDVGSESCDQFNHSGARSSRAAFNEILGVDVGLPKNLSAQVLVWFVQSWLYDLAPIAGVPVSDDNVNFRYVNIYLIELGWAPAKHIKVAGGFQTVNPQLAPDSTYYAPFFNRFTEVFLRGTYVF